MKAKLRGKITAMSITPDQWVTLTLEPAGSVTEIGTDKDNRLAPEAKATGMNVSIRVKALVASELRFGQTLFFSISTEEAS